MQKWEVLIIRRFDSKISFYPPRQVDYRWVAENHKFRHTDPDTLEFDRGTSSWIALVELLPQLGLEGWEPVSFQRDAKLFLFKRLIENQSRQSPVRSTR